MVDQKYIKAVRDLRNSLAKDLNEIGRFDHALDTALECVAVAEPGPDRAAAAAAFGGALRRIRGEIRIEIAVEMMTLLDITPTVHVARAVMKTVFSQSVSGDLLVDRFAAPGRSASNKVMPDARKKLDTPEAEWLAKNFGEIYEWYTKIALPERVIYIKLQRSLPKRKNKKIEKEKIPGY